MKGGMQFVDINPPVSGQLSFNGNEKNLQFKKKEVQTHSKLKDGTHLKFTLYNIEPFHEYENETFDLSDLGDDMKDINSIEHLYLCGFLTGWVKKDFFIKKGKVGDEGNKTENNKKLFKEIGKALNKICQKIKNDHDERTNKIQIILAHSKPNKELCIIFNMSNIDESYDLLKNYFPKTLFSDEIELMRKVTESQLKNLIDFTNEKLIIKPKADFTVGLINDLKQEISYKNLIIKLEQKIIEKVFTDSKINGEAEYESLVNDITRLDNILKLIAFFTKLKKELGDSKGYELDTKKAYVNYVNNNLNKLQSLKNNIEAELSKSKTRFLLSLLFGNATVEATADEQKTETVDKPEQDIRAVTSPETTKTVLEVEKKLKEKLSYWRMNRRFGSINVKQVLKAAEINAIKYKELIAKLAIEEQSVGGGKKKKLIRGGALTTDEIETVNKVLKSLQKADDGKNKEYFEETQAMLLQYERMVSTITQVAEAAAAAAEKFKDINHIIYNIANTKIFDSSKFNFKQEKEKLNEVKAAEREVENVVIEVERVKQLVVEIEEKDKLTKSTLLALGIQTILINYEKISKEKIQKMTSAFHQASSLSTEITKKYNKYQIRIALQNKEALNNVFSALNFASEAENAVAELKEAAAKAVAEAEAEAEAKAEAEARARAEAEAEAEAKAEAEAEARARERARAEAEADQAPPPKSEIYDDNFDPYEVLGLNGTETREEINKAYKTAALKWHPDKNFGRETLVLERTLNITRAKAILIKSKNESIKNQYKMRHKTYTNLMNTRSILSWPNYVFRFFLLFKNNIQLDTFNKIGGNNLDGEVFMKLTDESLKMKKIDVYEINKILGIQTQFTENSGMMPDKYTIF